MVGKVAIEVSYISMRTYTHLTFVRNRTTQTKPDLLWIAKDAIAELETVKLVFMGDLAETLVVMRCRR